jgi:hypothetical protein
VGKLWTGFAALVADVAFVIVRLLASSDTSPRVLLALAMICLVLSLGLFFLYFWVYQTHTIKHAFLVKIAGTEYTLAAEEYRNAHPDLSREQLLLDFAGQTQDVWTRESLTRARLILGGLYSLCIGSLAFGLLLAIEVLKSRGQP